MRTRNVFASFLVIGSLFLMVANTWGANVRGVTDNEVKIACLTDFSGPGKYGGPPTAAAFETYMAYINSQGGIHGRKIKLIVEDNGILPNTTLAAAKKVIFKDEVFAIAFNLGSSGASAIIPLCEENQVVLMPHGANKRFYHPGNKWVFVPYTTQYSMASRIVEYALEKNPKARIGIIYQDDDFGMDGLDGAQAAAKFMKTQLVKEAPYKIGTIDLSPHMIAMRDAKADTIILYTYLPQTASVLKEKQKMAWDVTLIGNNTTCVPPLFPLVGDLAEGYLSAIPIAPWESDVPGVRKAKEITKKFGDFEKLNDPVYPTPIYFGAWSYAVAMVEGLKRAGRDLTPETLIKGLESIKDLDMEGLCPNMTFGPNRHVSSFSTMIVRADAKNKRFVIVDPITEPKTPQY